MNKKSTKKTEVEKKFDVKMGKRLRELRESKKLTQMEFANWLADNGFEKSCATISKYENGGAPIPFRVICLLVKEYGIEVIETFWGKKINDGDEICKKVQAVLDEYNFREKTTESREKCNVTIRHRERERLIIST